MSDLCVVHRAAQCVRDRGYLRSVSQSSQWGESLQRPLENPAWAIGLQRAAPPRKVRITFYDSLPPRNSWRGPAFLVDFLVPGTAAGTDESAGWKKLFNGKDLDGWHIVIGNPARADTNHLVQVHDGMIHMYKDVLQGSPQPAGYLVTDKEYSNYHLKLEYKWGEKRFGGRAKARRDAGILYHVIGKDGVWPKSVECQIQENDVGDIFTVNTRLTAQVDSATTNVSILTTTNEAGVVRTNKQIQPVYQSLDQGGVAFVQGVGDGIRRVIRHPMAEHDGWNTVEVIVRGDEATYIVNGKVNNHATKLQQRVNDQWAPLNKGRIALQLEFAEVFYRNVEIKEEAGGVVE